MSISKITLSVCIAFVLIIGAYTGLWFWLAGNVQSQVEDWRADLAADGIDLSYADLDVSGFPDRVELNAENVRARALDGSWVATVPIIDVYLSPFDFSRVIGSFAGRGTVSIARDDGLQVFQFDTLRNSFIVDAETIDVDMSKLNVQAQPEKDVVLVDHFSAIFDRQQPKLRFSLENALVPAALDAPFGPTFERIAATVDVVGAPLPRVFSSDAVSAWSLAGGALDLSDIDFEQRPLDINGAGTLALDADLQPIGAMTFQIAGYSAALDQLMQHGAVGETEGRAAKAVLDFVSQRPTGDGPRTVEAPFTLQNRTLSIGPVSLKTFRPVTWF